MKEEKYHEDAGVSLPRPPVITIMGHVDHGKTTLLDYLRKTQVAENEAGGITQAISAFSVKVPGLSDSITFVDTPGHAAFNNMRARGAQTTDAVVLIIAADDGIMEQTVECIKHIKKADVPLIVAFNKMDKPKANTDKIKKDLLTHGLQLKEQGGDIDCVEISALKGNNVDELLVLLNGLSKKHTFKASYDGPAQIVVLETENSKQKGMTSMVLVKHGQLSKGKVLMTDDGFIKIRQLLNPYGQSVEKANPSDPVTLMGWRSMPNPGDVAIEVKNEAEARNILKVQSQKEKPEKVISNKPPVKSAGKKQLTQEMKGGRNKRIPLRVSLRAEAATGKVQQEEKSKTIDLIIKADVSGSLEAIVNILSRYHSTDITLNVLHAGVGSVNENDLKMLQTSEDSIVYAFNVDVTKNLMTQAEKLDVPVKQFDIIYKLLDDLKEKLENTLPMRSEEHIIGEAEVLKVFKLTGSRKNVAAGCRVKEGFLDNSNSEHLWKVIRDHQPVYEGG
uniref:Tr-type G domain-containing protein n=1 Tax=Clytia hemisphaerica TaxID=252671 RepID=A0A7M5U848_9CNID